MTTSFCQRRTSSQVRKRQFRSCGLSLAHLAREAAKAAEVGSFPKDKSWVGVEFGKLGQTCFGTLALEVYYRNVMTMR